LRQYRLPPLLFLRPPWPHPLHPLIFFTTYLAAPSCLYIFKCLALSFSPFFSPPLRPFWFLRVAPGAGSPNGTCAFFFFLYHSTRRDPAGGRFSCGQNRVDTSLDSVSPGGRFSEQGGTLIPRFWSASSKGPNFFSSTVGWSS